tara:strand:+ start:6430 stop:7038 length:609 start_codon:yes stop_codon:yes gene_type:complete
MTNLQVFLICFAFLFFLIISYLIFRSSFKRTTFSNDYNDQSSKDLSDLKQGDLDFGGEQIDEEKSQELIILKLHSSDKANFDVGQIINLIKNLGARYIEGFFVFFDHANQETFRIANALNPGIIDLETETNQIILVTDLHRVTDPLIALNKMLDMASLLADKTYATVCDQNQSLLSKQMVEHLKEKATAVMHSKRLHHQSYV